MSEPIRVLHVLTGMGSGGAEAFLMNMYRNIDRSQVQFDFLLCSSENIYAEELNNLGSRVYQIPKYTQHPIHNKQATQIFFHEHSYSIIHVHANALMNITPLIEAKRAGVPVRIMHSHSTSLKHKILQPLHQINKRLLHRWCTDRLACSDAAGKWMFPNDFVTIHNAINLEQFSYCTEDRSAVRQELGIPDGTFVIGHVGRFLPVKNHKFLFAVFQNVLMYNPNSILVLIGNGPLEQDIKSLAVQFKISDRILFLGVRKDVGRIMNALDTFILPSIYEGLGIAAIEAQANGLSVLCSDAIPKEAIITERVRQLPLTAGVECWARELLCSDKKRESTYQALVAAGYDIHTEAHKLQEFYLNKSQELS